MKRHVTALPFVMIAVIATIAVTGALAAVPGTMNYQGRLTNASGQNVTDGNYSLKFTLYDAASLGTVLWAETLHVAVASGLFSVELGRVHPVAAPLFSAPDRWIGIGVGSDPELTPRAKLTTVPYAFAMAGGADCADCNAIFVNAIGPDSVMSTAGTAFAGIVSSSTASNAYGIRGTAENTTSSDAYGGYFKANSPGTGSHFGILGSAYNLSSNPSYGVFGLGNNESNGPAYGGYFATNSVGTAGHYGVYGQGLGASDDTTFGCYGNASNSSSGEAYGGFFKAGSSGTGYHFGLRAEGYGSSSNSSVVGVYGQASTTGAPNEIYGGFFKADSSGGGSHIGIGAYAYNRSGAPVEGVLSVATGFSSGLVFGGNFNAQGSSGQTTGIDASASTSSTSPSYGVKAQASNYSSGNVYGGYFRAMISGSSPHFGMRGEANANSSSYTYGASGWAENDGSGDVYGGDFYCSSSGSGSHTGVRGVAYSSSTNPVYGAYGYADNTSSATVYGGYFMASSSGTGPKRGVYAYAPTAEGYAGYFSGNVYVSGTVTKGGGAFRIDHPLDPENKYLQHSFVESPDMKNVYDGVVSLNANGEATVTLPDYFEALNRDFRYQLTAIGAPGPNLYIAQKIAANMFRISGGTSGMEVSWQVTGIRKDAFANANRIQVEMDKNADEKGKYLHPEAFGADKTQGIEWENIRQAEETRPEPLPPDNNGKP